MRPSDPSSAREQVKTALLLAAGTGRRLSPLTDTTATCLVGVSLIPILERFIRSLTAYGFSRLVIVVGHEAAAIQDYLGDHSGDIQIDYVVNPLYETTGTAYSLWLARKEIDEPLLLVEGDVVFDESLLEDMLQPDRIAVSKQLPWMEGTTVTLDQTGRVCVICPGELHCTDPGHFKTVGIYSLARGTWKAACERLGTLATAGPTSDSYESTFAEMVSGGLALDAVFFPADRWYEIDTPADLDAAELVFPRLSIAMNDSTQAPATRRGRAGKAGRDSAPQIRAAREREYDSLASEHGGYWRHGFVDHAYIYNLYFPPEAIFEQLGSQIHELVLNYPVAQDVLAGLVGDVIDQPAERIAVGDGAAEIIKIISGQLAATLITPVPSFYEYTDAAPAGRAVPFVLEAPSFELDIDAFAAQAIRNKADFAVVVSPNNPTSLLVPKADLVRLAGLLAENGCALIVDESFIDFAEQGSGASLEAEIADLPNLAIIKSMSKAFGVCGLRIGYLLSANTALIERVRGGLPIWNVNGFAEEFLRLMPLYRHELASSCERVRADRDELYEQLCDVPGLTVYRPQANFVFCRLPEGAPSGPEVARKLFVQEHIYIKHLGTTAMAESDRYLRIASRTSAENKVAVNALRRVVAPNGRR